VVSLASPVMLTVRFSIRSPHFHLPVVPSARFTFRWSGGRKALVVDSWPGSTWCSCCWLLYIGQSVNQFICLTWIVPCSVFWTRHSRTPVKYCSSFSSGYIAVINDQPHGSSFSHPLRSVSRTLCVLLCFSVFPVFLIRDVSASSIHLNLTDGWMDGWWCIRFFVTCPTIIFSRALTPRIPPYTSSHSFTSFIAFSVMLHVYLNTLRLKNRTAMTNMMT